MKMEPTLRSTQVLKQEAEDIGLQGKDIAEYVTRQQTSNREERAAWRDAQKMKAQAEEKKKANEIWMAEINDRIEREQTNCRRKRRKGQMKSSSRLQSLRLRL